MMNSSINSSSVISIIYSIEINPIKFCRLKLENTFAEKITSSGKVHGGHYERILATKSCSARTLDFVSKSDRFNSTKAAFKI